MRKIFWRLVFAATLPIPSLKHTSLEVPLLILPPLKELVNALLSFRQFRNPLQSVKETLRVTVLALV